MAGNPEQSEPDPQPRATRRGWRLPVIALCAWALFAFAAPRAALPLNVADVLGFPIGFFMMATGSFVAFLVIAVLAARRLDRREAAFAERRSP